MKSLYVSDLDGTLFNSKKNISEFTTDILNRFIARGGLFTIATARMAYGCDEKLKSINLNVPGIIMNGACLYAFDKKEYLDVQEIDPSKIQEIENAFDQFGCNAYMFAYKNHGLSIYYKLDPSAQDSQYLSERAKEECKEIKKIDRYTTAASNRQIIYFASTGTKVKIQSVWEKVRYIEGIEPVMYLNIYNGLYCLEIFDKNANKANALKRLMNLLQVDETIVFGDNHNDISIMQIADQSYAPGNALDEVKQLATGVIDSCDNDGVARFLQEKYSI